VVQGKGSQKHRSMFKIFIVYLARNRIWQNLPVIIAILANCCTHIKHWYVPSESISFKHRFIFLWRKLAYFAPKKKKKKKNKFPATWSRKRFGKFPENLPHFEEKNVFNSSRFLEDLGRFVAFFY
jgi:hypothetical protein